uniref:Uncharacterized protein n=2 Tax=cellular organisms TaxID=131567 RepID=A0A494G9X4_SOLLC
MFGRQDKSDAANQAKHADASEAVTALAGEVKALSDKFSKVLQAVETVAGQVDKLQEEQSAASKEFSTLKGELENTETFTKRPPATGGSGDAAIKTDC